MKLLNRNLLNCCIVTPSQCRGASSNSTIQRFKGSTVRSAFTLVELILVLALLVIATSLAAPALSNFVRGRALDSEARRLAALMHAGQSRAVSEGAVMMLWIDEKTGDYGLEAETSGQNGDAKAEKLTVESLGASTASPSWLRKELDIEESSFGEALDRVHRSARWK